MYYKPQDGWTGDPIPFYDGKEFRLFYLKTSRTGEHFSDVAWNMVSTPDFVHYHDDVPTGIEGGTGSVIQADGDYHLFYCDNSRPEKQLTCHALSRDLVHWKKLPEDTFEADGGIYEKPNWRDPHVLWNESAGEFWMLTAGRTAGGTNRCGCTGLCVSRDLRRWEFRQPLFAPHIDVGAHECPDLFRIGGWWYLTYSTYTGFYATVYRMSRSPEGPWLIPERETLDSRAFYAGKTVQKDGEVYLVGWNPTREAAYCPGWNPAGAGGHDYDTFDWGGNLIVHRLRQNEDGTLRVGIPGSVDTYLSRESGFSLRTLTGAWRQEGDSFVSADDGYSLLSAAPLPKLCKISFDLKFDASMRRCGVALRIDGRADKGYYLTFDRQYHRIAFSSYLMETLDGWLRIPYMTELERPLLLKDDTLYHVCVVVDDTIGEVYVNDEVAMSFRMYDLTDGAWGLFSLGRGTVFSNISLRGPVESAL